MPTFSCGPSIPEQVCDDADISRRPPPRCYSRRTVAEASTETHADAQRHLPLLTLCAITFIAWFLIAYGQWSF
jgi:hypothetical protein